MLALLQRTEAGIGLKVIFAGFILGLLLGWLILSAALFVARVVPRAIPVLIVVSFIVNIAKPDLGRKRQRDVGLMVFSSARQRIASTSATGKATASRM